MLDKGPTLIKNLDMPSKNIVKIYTPNSYYHIYNRGIEKRVIFLDHRDFKKFLYYLKLYLSPKDEILQLAQIDPGVQRFYPLNLSEEIDLVAYALMPNHFHLLLKQTSNNGITKFMRRLSTAYVMYFNKKYDRVGSLFQNRFKACNVNSDSYILHLSRYIHLNPLSLKQSSYLKNCTSYPNYLGEQRVSWCKPKFILDYFNSGYSKLNSVNSYKAFVEDYSIDSSSVLGPLVLESK